MLSLLLVQTGEKKTLAHTNGGCDCEMLSTSWFRLRKQKTHNLYTDTHSAYGILSILNWINFAKIKILSSKKAAQVSVLEHFGCEKNVNDSQGATELPIEGNALSIRLELLESFSFF